MKLSKLYCNKPDFKNIKFNLTGLNVIYADVQSQPHEKKNSHSLGKTKLAEIIDYLLGKQLDHKKFPLKNTDENGNIIFIEYVFYLELQLNSGEFLTIKREIYNHSKTYFSLNNNSVVDFIPPTNWSEPYGIKKAKEKLNEYLALDFFRGKDYDYRKAVNYCIRRQEDYEDVYTLSKFIRGKDKDWKPFMFDLLGFRGDILKAKYNNDEKQEEINKKIDTLKSEFSVNENSRDEVIAQLTLNEGKAKKIEKNIDAFNFYEQDKRLITKGVEEIETKISELNTVSYNLNYDIEKLQSSIKNNFAFDIAKVERVFQETQLFFPEKLKVNYEGLLSFNKEITKERNKLLKSTLESKKEELKDINNELVSLNNKKEELLNFLQDTDVFHKFKTYQKELSEINGEIINLRKRIEVVDAIVEKEKERELLKKNIEDTIGNLRELQNHTDKNEKYNRIRSLFSEYFREVMNEDTYIAWELNNNNNVEFKQPEVRYTSKDEGRTYKKLLCVIFDLAILVAYNKESYFRFVYHDDVLSQQDNGIKRRLLNLIEKLSVQYDFQYILSAIKSDLPTDEEDNPIYFPENEIILKLHDKDESGTLFGFEF